MVNYTTEIRFMVQTLRTDIRPLGFFLQSWTAYLSFFPIWTRCYLDFKEPMKHSTWSLEVFFKEKISKGDNTLEPLEGQNILILFQQNRDEARERNA